MKRADTVAEFDANTTADTFAPNITIVSPADGATVSGTVAVQVSGCGDTPAVQAAGGFCREKSHRAGGWCG